LIIRLIAQSHLDPVFMWTWQEGLAEAIATCKAAIDKLNKYNDLLFIRSDALIYKWIEKADPKLLESIKSFVNQGRWIPIGGFYTQADVCSISGESIIRQALIGQEVFKGLFGSQSKVAYLPDTWGLGAALPKILKHSGFDYFIFCRPNEDRLPLESPLFKWLSDDMSDILCYKIPVIYTTYANEIERIKQVLDRKPKWLDEMMCFFGVGNHGGGPTEQQIERVINYSKQPDAPEIAFSHPERFFESVNDNPNIPVYRGCFERFGVGCYSNAISLKQLHDKAQFKLLIAEKYAAIASKLGLANYDLKEMNSCWEDLLFTQFHDFLPGTAVKDGLEDAKHIAGSVLSKASRIGVFAQNRILSQVDTSQQAFVRFAAFNNTNRNGLFYFEYQPWLLWQKWKNYKLVDEKGSEVPCQQTIPSPAARGHTKLIIKTDLPANGFKLLRIIGPEPDLSKIHPDTAEFMQKDYPPVKKIKSPNYNIVFNESGGIDSLVHKNSTELSPKGIFDFEVYEDKSDTWAIHHRNFAKHKLLGKFKGKDFPLQLDTGQLRWSAQQNLVFNTSEIKQEIRTHDSSDLIEVCTKLFWNQPRSLMKLTIPIPFKNCRVYSGLAFGKAIRTHEEYEFPFHDWIFAEAVLPSGELKGLAIIVGPGMHSADFTGSSIRLTLVRSPIYCHEELERSYPPTPGHEAMEMGVHEFSFGILPVWQNQEFNMASLAELAKTFYEPVSTITTTGHKGYFDPNWQFVEISHPNVELTAFKRSQDNTGYIMRFWETAGKETTFDLKCIDCRFKVHIEANGLTSIKVYDAGKQWSFKKVNGLEE